MSSITLCCSAKRVRRIRLNLEIKASAVPEVVSPKSKPITTETLGPKVRLCSTVVSTVVRTSNASAFSKSTLLENLF